MPNPFMRAQRVTSKSNVERVEPVPEKVHGFNLPYRGLEQHGVEQHDHFASPVTDVAEGRPVDLYEVEDPGPAPIPVRIVDAQRHERRAFMPIVAYAGAVGNPSLVLGRDDHRNSAEIKNIDAAAVIYLGSTASQADPMSGYPLKPGEKYVTTSESSIYAVSDQSNTIKIVIATEIVRGLD